MVIKKKCQYQSTVLPSEITSESHYQNRRSFIKSLGLVASGLILPRAPSFAQDTRVQPVILPDGKLKVASLSTFSTTEDKTPFSEVTSYNNFYEFGTDKSDPAKNAHTLKTDPWSIVIEGLCDKPQTLALEDILRLAPIEERIYRMRCVEGWSMVIPWNGIPLSALLNHVGVQSAAKYVEFITLNDAEQMPGINDRIIEWPYREGLRIDEAMNELTLLAVGLYGQILPNQNGAPIRLVVPWKYGFKGIKSIVKIRLVDTMPVSAWMKANSREYGFYANVNPNVSHPRWSQARERRIGEFRKRETLMFNGYAEQVAHLYQGMDLAKYY